MVCTEMGPNPVLSYLEVSPIEISGIYFKADVHKAELCTMGYY